MYLLATILCSDLVVLYGEHLKEKKGVGENLTRTTQLRTQTCSFQNSGH